MKLKEVCTETGLSRKTIRLYEEKGLLVPQKEYRNGREYREYTVEDIHKLKIIALLRRAWFTMDEIRQMQEDPEAIQDIFPQYIEWLRNQKRELDELIAVAENVAVHEVTDVEDLTEHMAEAALKLPLPQWDIHPRFKYLDEIEEAIIMKQEKVLLEDNKVDAKVYRQSALVLDKDRVNDHAITFGQIRELEEGNWNESGPVKNEVVLPKAVKIVSKIGTVIAIVGLVLFLINYVHSMFHFSGREISPYTILGIILTITGFAICGAVHAYAAIQERKRWLKVVREQDEEKKKQG